MEELMALKGTNGTIRLYEDRVVIQRNGIFALSSQGFVGDRIYYYKDLQGVEYKKPGMINGYIKFIVAGTNDVNSKVGLFSTTKESAQDPNTIILRSFNSKIPVESEKLYKTIMKKIRECKNVNNNSSVSNADEILKFKQLLEQGIITQEEFERKKQELL